MKDEYTPENLKIIGKNPFFHKLNKEVTLAVKNETYAIYNEIAKANGEPIEKAMRRCLEIFAKDLKEHE